MPKLFAHHAIDRSIFYRAAVVTLLASAATLALPAQQAGSLFFAPQPDGPSSKLFFAAQPAAKPSKLVAVNDSPAFPDASLDYSSSAGTGATAAAEGFNFDPQSQTPPPRRYGRRPVYADGSHNADGSNKYTFAAGGGFTLPVGGTKGYATTSYSFQGGIGRNFNKKYALMAQFDWDNFGINGTALNQFATGFQNVYGVSPTQAVGSSGYGGNGAAGPLTASMHVWSFTLNPIYNLYQADHIGAYAVVGGGYYHKVSTFSVPQAGQGGYGFYSYQTVYNQRVDHYTSNAPGFNGGFGFTYKFSHFGSAKAFAEARYVYVLNSTRPYFDGTAQGYNGQPPSQYNNNPNYINIFPQNSARTTYIPVKFGIRF